MPFKAFKDETAVRRWVAALPCRKDWTEPPKNSIGATPGMCDVTLDVGYSLPIELKCWEMLGRGEFAARLRREQVRYHYVRNLKRPVTLLMFGCPTVPGIFVLPASLIPLTVVARVRPEDAFVYMDGLSFLDDARSRKFFG